MSPALPVKVTTEPACLSVPAAGDEDGLVLRNAPQQSARLLNSEVLAKLESHLGHLCSDHRKGIVNLITSYPSLFGDVPTQTSVLQHDIVVTDPKPIRQHPYRVNAAKRAVMREEVQYLLEHQLARKSSSPWSSPCILVPKPDGTSRFCTDFRKVNSVTLPELLSSSADGGLCGQYWLGKVCQ